MKVLPMVRRVRDNDGFYEWYSGIMNHAGRAYSGAKPGFFTKQ